MAIPSKDSLKKAIIKALRKQGYRVRRGIIDMPDDLTKDDYRRMNKLAVAKKM